MAGVYEPSPVWGHFSAPVQNRWYTWGGDSKDVEDEKISWEDFKSSVNTYDPYLETWTRLNTTGTPPSGVYGGACAAVGHHLYTYGGRDTSNSYVHVDSFHQLDTRTLVWSELPNGPMRKAGSRMIACDNKLFLLGGYGIPSGPIQPGSEFILDEYANDGSGWTNEIHSFDLTKGE